MDINTMTTSPIDQINLRNGIAMPTRGLVSGCPQALAGGTDLTIGQPTTIARARKVSTKGHVAFAAYVPGIHAWSPPLC